ncbi:MAG: phenylacetate--CoA ligase family protein [Candidatus Omnitrophica bacterium]|nr:phenylacetate--CoA ligase family protein [Candidatus Omnitrophota bacterium]MCB9747020.1 phenylacetate--CoA ligase family protein [Candidatus Omnitrophota bacterium]
MSMLKDYFKNKLRTGKLFKSLLKELQLSENFSKQEMRNFHNEKLQKIMKIAFTNIPYYQQVMKSRNLTFQDIKNVDDLKRLPLIDKTIVRENFQEFRNTQHKGPIFKGLSSGTTGRSGVYLRDIRSINFENAVLWRLYQKVGKKVNSRRVTLRGELPCSIDQKEPPFWRVNRFSKELIMSSFHLNDTNMSAYVDEINKYRPYDLHAYPASAYLLAEYCLRMNKNINFEIIFTSSETLMPQQKETIEKAFNGKVCDIYGQAERVAMIIHNEFGDYNIIEDYSIVELLPIEDGRYEVIGTTLNNYLMPLIRYRTGDIVEMNSKEYDDKYVSFRSVKQVMGRFDTHLKTPDGRKFGAAALSMIPKGVDNIIESQFVQKQLGEVILRIVCTKDFSDKDELKLKNNINKYLSKEIRVFIEKVKSIPRTKAGKFLLVVDKSNQDLKSDE